MNIQIHRNLSNYNEKNVKGCYASGDVFYLKYFTFFNAVVCIIEAALEAKNSMHNKIK